ncbi:MAG TPA: hypothetical protein DER68_02290, partial [Ruminococcaceae bacterium]|nr:hypothetical protein [Oscillospiraceae bacterium]
DGTIGVESTLGVGSEFWFEIPQEIASDKPAGEFTENRRDIAETSREYHELFQAPAARILVVDDVKLNIDVMKGLLKRTRICVDAAYSGRECLGLVQKNNYDLVFMDHLMPEMDGIQTLNFMRKNVDSPNHNVPVIALTANAVAGAREKYTALGFSDYLAKPVQADKLERLCCGLKSAAKTVGGEKLSRLAGKMEKNVKNGDISCVRENHRTLIDCCHSFEKAANRYLFSNNYEGDKH